MLEAEAHPFQKNGQAPKLTAQREDARHRGDAQEGRQPDDCGWAIDEPKNKIIGRAVGKAMLPEEAFGHAVWFPSPPLPFLDPPLLPMAWHHSWSF